jgi:hypothetical protein
MGHETICSKFFCAVIVIVSFRVGTATSRNESHGTHKKVFFEIEKQNQKSEFEGAVPKARRKEHKTPPRSIFFQR